MMLFDSKNTYAIAFNHGQFKQIIEKIENLISKTKFEQVLLAYCYSLIGNDEASLERLPEIINEDEFDSPIEYAQAKIMEIRVIIKSGSYADLESNLNSIQKYFSKIKEDNISRFLLYFTEITFAEFLISKSFLNKAVTDLHQIIEDMKDDKHPELATLFALAYYHIGTANRYLANYNEALENYDQALKLSINFKDKTIYANTLNHIGILYASQNKIETALNYFYEIIAMEDELKDELLKSKVLTNLGNIQYIQGDMKKALEYYEHGLQISKNIQNYNNLVTYHINMGNIKQQESKFAEALNYYRRAHSYRYKVNNDTSLAKILFSIGTVHKKLGQFKQAMYHLDKALQLEDKIGDRALIAKIINNQAVIENIRGNTTSAIEKFTEVLKISKEMKDKVLESIVYTNLALVYSKLDQYDKALDHLKKSYKLKLKCGNSIALAVTLHHIIQIELSRDNMKAVEKYMDELKNLAKSSDNIEILSRYNLAKATILQQSEDESDQFVASQLLEEVLSGEYVNFEINIFAMISFCEYLLMELRNTNSSEIFLTLESTVNRLYELATENESHELIAKTLIIQAKLSILGFKMNEAIYYLNQAHTIADNHNLEQVKLKISFLESQVQQSLYQVTDELYSDSDLEDRIDQLEIIDYVRNLYYQQKANDILRADISNIRRFNTELANFIKINEHVPISLENLANIVDLTSREINVLYRSLLIIEKIENQKYDYQENEINLGLILEDLMDIYKPGFTNNSIKMEVQGDLSNLYLRGDTELVEKSIDHIFLNAIKFTPKHKKFKIKVTQEDGKCVLLFQNNCKTIPPEILLNLTEKYFQYSPKPKLVKGYGIGLTFVELAAKQMNHTIKIESPIPESDDGFQITVILSS